MGHTGRLPDHRRWPWAVRPCAQRSPGLTIPHPEVAFSHYRGGGEGRGGCRERCSHTRLDNKRLLAFFAFLGVFPVGYCLLFSAAGGVSG